MPTRISSFDEVFKKATRRIHYPFQRRFASGTKLPYLVKIPTGLGKTAMAVLGWIWRRRFAEEIVREATPRRLVYCLPMRVLVEQTCKAVKDWIVNLELASDIKVYVLMGGEEAEDWDLYPERDAILIGTQDMLLSRALNRGYGMSRYRWPMHYALLNNDCLWILDEVQLMGTGLATTTQLQGLRNRLGTFGDVQSVWMSATLEPSWLKTVDFDPASLGKPLILEDEDFENQEISARHKAAKILAKADSAGDDPKGLASEAVRLHQPGTRTLVVVNTVNRARLLYSEIAKLKPKAKILLIHSRFRLPDRKQKVEQLLGTPGPAGMIVVSTQVIEAGVDVSAKTLLAELAPWASLVQRFGRCNRAGEFTAEHSARIYWVDLSTVDETSRKKFAPPYRAEDLDLARRFLEKLEGQSTAPATLDNLPVKLRFVHTHIIRTKDVIELFDTTPDLAGNDLDIDRYVRETDDSDVQVFWRDLGGTAPLPQEPLPVRDELCPAPISEFRGFVEALRKAQHVSVRKVYRRNFLERVWEAATNRDIYPGQSFLLDMNSGGYDPNFGWTSEVSKKNSESVVPIAQLLPIKMEDGDDADPWSQIGVWQTIAQHTDEVCEELEDIMGVLHVPQVEALRIAARWHDWGKAHWIFQAVVRDEHPAQGARPRAWIDNREIAKAPGKAKLKDGTVLDPGWWFSRYKRPHFRHELASALAVLQADAALPSDMRDLAAYVIAAHHGRVRVSIRSFPGERKPEDGLRFARGIWEGDLLPCVDLGGAVIAPATPLSLGLMEMGMSDNGKPSWAERMLGLRDGFGPFRLAFLETLLRAADMRASSKTTLPTGKLS